MQILLFFCFHLEAQLLKSKWQLIDIGGNIGAAEMEAYNLDNDNKDEIVISGMRGSIKIEHMKNNYFVTSNGDLYNADTNLPGLTCADSYQDDGKIKLLSCRSNGEIQIYDAANFCLLNEFDILKAINDPAAHRLSSLCPLDCEVVDLNSDGKLEIVLIGFEYLLIMDEATLEKIYFSTQIKSVNRLVNGKNVLVGNIDSDDCLEIFCSDGSVFDLNKMEIENRINFRLYKNFTLANADADDNLEIVFQNNDHDVIALDGETADTIFVMKEMDGVSLLKYINADDDDEYELVVGTYNHAKLKIYDLNPLVFQKQFTDRYTACVSNVTIGDTDGDGEKEIIWSIGGCSTDNDNLLIADLNTGILEWESTVLLPIFQISCVTDSISGIGNLFCSYKNDVIKFSDQDSIVDKVYSTTLSQITSLESISLYEPYDSLLFVNETIKDMKTNTTRIIPIDEGYYKEVYSILTGDIDHDESIELVVGTKGGYIFIYDFLTLEKEFSITPSKLRASSIYDILVGGINTGSQGKLFYCASNYDNNRLNALIGWIDLDSCVVDYSVVIEGNSVYSITLLDLDSDGINELYAGLVDGRIIRFDMINMSYSVFYDAGYSISNIAFANIDSEPGLELIINGEKLTIIDLSNFEEKFVSNSYYSPLSFNDLVVNDIDNDGLMDIFITNYFGIFAYEAEEQYLKTASIDESDLLEPDIHLYQNYPNPFNPTSKISYSISQPSIVSIIIYDILGKKVATLVNEEKKAGYYTKEFSAPNLSSGIYFYQLRVNNFIETKKMILLR